MKQLAMLSSFFLMLFLAFGCEMNDGPNSNEARVNFRLVDAPADFDEVWVEVISLRIKADYDGSDMNEEESTWKEIKYDGPKMVNLLNLTGGNSILLGSEELPEGKIDQIRLVLGENNYLMKGQVRTELKTPSAQQSGLKIKVNQEIEGGNTYDLVIDFDVAKSIVVAGNSGNVILKPVLRAYLEQSQGIQGQVNPVEAQPIQISITGNGVEANTFTNAEGKFSILGLNPGTYTVSIIPNENYDSQTITNVVVEEDKITTLPTITLVQL
ncbi:DUF4382 domain-containing protein [Algoriphagus sp. AK58]|uniref:DUF4382 domain-containing protein n=1 Tax=Algoriphagus sp. AK58 TaxID=1406877 RepID=UPI00165045A3|nr:DUF4382 domain-containing protein [Algoriphagus sp. AK58]MBC6365468.1 hypothetical protein [Algoriphagus sp. AK58]